MANAERLEGRDQRTRPPSLAAGGERRRIERRLQQAGILCQPEVSVQYQMLARRSVLRGVESGGATKEIGRYVTFCDDKGKRIPWLQPIDSIALNGRHAVVIAPAFVSVEVFRVRSTYDVLIVRHDAVEGADGRRGHMEANVFFRGHQGYLPLNLTGDEKEMAGQIVPEFFNKAGEQIEIPREFVGALRAAVRGANCVGCAHQHYLIAPKPPPPPPPPPKASTDAVTPAPVDDPARGDHALAV
jgi:hypothetical protein